MTVREPGPQLSLLPRYAILVDVGYLYAAAGDLLFGMSTRRAYRVDAEGLIKALEKRADKTMRGSCSGSTGSTPPEIGFRRSTSGSSRRCHGSSYGLAT